LKKKQGYRSILDAMKSFAVNRSPIDIEELNKLKCLNQTSPSERDANNGKRKRVHIISDQTSQWYVPVNMNDLYRLLSNYASKAYRIVSGNTGVGVYKSDGPGPSGVYIDIKNIAELYQVSTAGGGLTLGAAITLKSAIDIFNSYAKTAGYQYFTQLVTHLGKVANVSVRNSATLSGNLMLKYFHNEFVSDVFVCMETVGAVLKLVGPDSTTQSVLVTPAELLRTPMSGKIIYSIYLPQYDNKTFIRTYKVMPRAQNAHAYVNAGFSFTIDTVTYYVKLKPSIVFGGIGKAFVHAVHTENYLIGKSLLDASVLQKAFDILNSEMNADLDPVLASVDYRKSLACALLYKFILFVCKGYVAARYLSGASSVIESRALSTGQQSYPTNPGMYPVTQPMTKLNACLQASGEAQYVHDVPLSAQELHGAFVQATVCNSNIDKIDTSTALAMPGVVSVLLAKHIPGTNSFVPLPGYAEQLFCDDYVSYVGQAVGLVVAKTARQASEAARAVQITYKNVKKPLLTIQDAIAAQSFFPKPADDFVYGNAEDAIAKSPCVIEGKKQSTTHIK
jgi:xanthine dehydrogenase/oxidase